MADGGRSDLERRVLLLTPTARDGQATRDLLAGLGIDSHLCSDLAEVCREIERGAGAVLIAEEAVVGEASDCLVDLLRAQETWSDLPLIVLTQGGPGERDAPLGMIRDPGHVMLLKRPVDVPALVSAIQAALRDRDRQYRTRDQIREIAAQAEALRESEERFRALANASPVLIWMAGIDRGRTWFNRSWLEFVGRRLEDELGDRWAESVHPADRPRAAESYTAAFDARRPFTIEYRLRRRDGAHRWLLENGTPLFERSGRFRGYIGSCVDITEMKEAQDRLRDSEAKYRTLADNVSHLFWTCRPDGWCDYLSRQWVAYTGVPEAEQHGFAWLDRVVHPDDRERTRGSWLAAVEGRCGYDVEYRIRGADGAYRWFKARGTPIRDARGVITRWFGTCTEIDDRVRAEEALRAADRRKNEFLAMLAHELRNPLAAIANASRLLQLDEGAGRREWASAVLERQVRHLSRLVDDLLDVSRIDRGKIELKRQPFDAAHALRQAIEASSGLLAARRHRLELDLSPHPLPLNADPTRLEQVFVNLLSNAAKYTPEGGHVWVSAGAEGGWAVIRVRDDGIGIPPERIPEMFELFAQGDQALARSEGGLGIGLTLVRTLVEMHGGRVEAHSEGKGRGSEFVVRLPLVGQVDRRREAPARVDAPPRRVLIVDDSIDGARGLALLLGHLGHEVETAHNGPEALERAFRRPPDVVLLDIGLPGMDGYEVARRLRREPALAATRILAVSGYGDPEHRVRSAASGIDHHLLKPVDPDTLAALIGEPAR